MLSIILGTRPEIIKLYPLISLLKKEKINFNIIHTGQHYSNNLNNIFLKQLRIPKNKIINLKVGSTHHARQISLMAIGIEKYLKNNKKVKAVIVYGDTNSALAGSLASINIKNIYLIHLEAGLRSFDKNMPEEISRRLIDHCSDLLLCPTKTSKDYLLKEGIKKDKIHIVGNTIVDALKSKIVQSSIKKNFNKLKKNYLLLTIHREENTFDPNKLKIIISSIQKICKNQKLHAIFPIHPKTKKLLSRLKYDQKLIRVIQPLNYLSFINLLKNCKIVVSDSGGIQEEACILKIPLITVRNSTERPETIKIGCNILTSVSSNNIYKNAKIILKKKIYWKNPYGKGDASKKSLKIIQKMIHKNEKKYY